jgi:uncharacterized damage-inducible protein DinB
MTSPAMTDALIDTFQMLARYNRGANRILYDACARLPEAELKRQRPAFFRSIHGTLNHILMGDRIWMARFAGRDVPSTGLDAILYDGFAALRAARVELDHRIEGFMAGLTPAFLAGSIRYVNNAGLPYDDPVPLLLTHFFNHQTHHRGQVHDQLSQTDVAPPSLDLHRVLRPDPIASW